MVVVGGGVILDKLVAPNWPPRFYFLVILKYVMSFINYPDVYKLYLIVKSRIQNVILRFYFMNIRYPTIRERISKGW